MIALKKSINRFELFYFNFIFDKNIIYSSWIIFVIIRFPKTYTSFLRRNVSTQLTPSLSTPFAKPAKAMQSILPLNYQQFIKPDTNFPLNCHFPPFNFPMGGMQSALFATSLNASAWNRNYAFRNI